MRRIDRIYEFIKQQSQEATCAQEVATALNLTRANASNDLNQLVREKKLIKIPGKPVTFSLNPATSNFLDRFSQLNPSLTTAIQHAQAAVLYPPQRMHILLSGATGVGKSMFAELIYRFSIDQGRISPSAQLVTFNCADYASNPQLILSQLFGVVAGAYTGADRDRSGLLECADGGVLFLDEVHRLAPEAQEILFTFIDKKIFHRLGETTFDRSADVQLICATTEDIDSSLLQTFTRRIPMKISLPSLNDRDLSERMQLITTFFDKEAVNIDRDIRVSMNTIRALLSYECKSNIGQLKADIQLLCAQGYARLLAANEEKVTITSFHLPDYIKAGLYKENKRHQLWTFLPVSTDRFMDFYRHQSSELPLISTTDTDIYQVIDHKLLDMEKIGLNQQTKMDVINMTIHDYFTSFPAKNVRENVSTVVGTEVYACAKQFAETVCGEMFPLTENLINGLALHLYNLLQRIKEGKRIINPKLAEIKATQSQTLLRIKQHQHLIEEAFAIRIPEAESGFLTLFFTPLHQDLIDHQVKVIIVAHGESTATSMADIVNQLLGNDEVAGFNMPLTCKPAALLTELTGYLQQISQRHILLLTDMGSLTNFSEELQKLGCHVRCLDLVSTLHVLEASRKASLGHSLDEIADSLHQISHTTGKNVEGQSRRQRLIVTACTTGTGSAKMIKELLEKQLDLADGNVTILPMQITEKQLFEAELRRLKESGSLLCYVSSFPLPLSVPYFDLTEVFQEGPLKEIQQLITFDIAAELAIENVSSMIETTNGVILLENLKNWVQTISLKQQQPLSPELKIGLMCHLASLIDGLRQQAASSPEKSALESLLADPQLQFFATQLRSLELIYGVRFDETQLGHIRSYVCI